MKKPIFSLFSILAISLNLYASSSTTSQAERINASLQELPNYKVRASLSVDQSVFSLTFPDSNLKAIKSPHFTSISTDRETVSDPSKDPVYFFSLIDPLPSNAISNIDELEKAAKKEFPEVKVFKKGRCILIIGTRNVEKEESEQFFNSFEHLVSSEIVAQ